MTHSKFITGYYLILPTLSVMYFDQLLRAVRFVHVVYLDQPLGAAHLYTLYLITINIGMNLNLELNNMQTIKWYNFYHKSGFGHLRQLEKCGASSEHLSQSPYRCKFLDVTDSPIHVVRLSYFEI